MTRLDGWRYFPTVGRPPGVERVQLFKLLERYDRSEVEVLKAS